MRESKYLNFRLKYVNDDSNGFIIYEFDDKDKNLNELLRIQIYHLIKDFFHSHEYHAPENDCQLKAFVCDRQNDMPACMKHYGNQFIKKFEAYKKIFDDERPEKIWQRFLEDRILKKGVDKITRAERILQNVRGEMVYARFLLSSMFHYRDMYKIYRHIRAHLRVLEDEFDMLQMSYTNVLSRMSAYYTSDTYKVQIYIAITGIVLTLLSL